MRGYSEGQSCPLFHWEFSSSAGWLMAHNRQSKTSSSFTYLRRCSSWSSYPSASKRRASMSRPVGKPAAHSRLQVICATKRAHRCRRRPRYSSLVTHMVAWVITVGREMTRKLPGPRLLAAFASLRTQTRIHHGVQAVPRPPAQQSEKPANDGFHSFDSRRHETAFAAGPDQGGKGAPCCGRSSKNRSSIFERNHGSGWQQ